MKSDVVVKEGGVEGVLNKYETIVERVIHLFRMKIRPREFLPLLMPIHTKTPPTSQS